MRDVARPQGAFATLLLTALALGGCASVATEDLVFKSLQVVERRERPEIRRVGDLGSVLARMTGDLSVIRAPEVHKLGPGIDAASELLLKVEFTSRFNFSGIAYGDDLGNKVFFCQRPDAHVRLALPYVYADGHEVPSGDREGRDGSSGTAYYIFLRVALDEREPGKPPFQSFDLRRTSEDVCFRLEWGRYRKLGYTTNVVVIPSEAIASALR